MGWEIELVVKGQPRTGMPTTSLITGKTYTFTGLTPSTAYEVYIRTVCNTGVYSAWNVAVPFNTVIEIPSACPIQLPLKDNGTETLLLDVKEKGILGKDVFFEGIDLMIAHTWPADLKIVLVSPQGQQVTLSNHNGTVKDNFGDINDDSCNGVTTFSPGACLELKESVPPYIGVFRPDGDMENWKADTLSKGFWKLIFTDRALKDAGTLKYVNLRFNTQKCVVPQDFVIKEINSNAITVGWKSSEVCNTAKIILLKDGVPEKTIFTECSVESHTFQGLIPNTIYELVIRGICSDFSQSQESCTLSATTRCESISFAESFDDRPTCSEGCSFVCPISGGYWYNPTQDGDQDWIVWSGKTDTENTGPEGDVNSNGKYVYIESNPDICTAGKQVFLQSTCIDIKSNDSGCDMSFYYHMYGSDVTSLTLQISTDNGISWADLFKAQGNQGNKWKRATLSLTAYKNLSALFRFTAVTAAGPLSDIAIDQIEFYKSTPVAQIYAYYRDKDADGYGILSEKIEICDVSIPVGFSRFAGDCDDDNAAIHPESAEIPCNATDENCNGNGDDAPSTNPITATAVIQNASCNGSADGSITLQITGGTAPYSVQWNTGFSGIQAGNLKAGVYFATISDAGGCQFKTAFYEISASTILNIIVTGKEIPGCRGKSDGAIYIEHTASTGPYQYLWSNGSTEKNQIQLPEGVYSVSVTDGLQCSAFLENIVLNSRPSVITDIKTIRQPLCAGQNTGEVELISFNGSPPYQYLWSTGQTTAHISGLSSGLYTCTIHDAALCLNVFEISIKAPPMLTGKVLSTENVRCFGESNGAIKTDFSGGTPPYTYLWNNGAYLTEDIIQLKAGTYTLKATDNNGCVRTLPPILIQEPPLLEIFVDSITPASCILGYNGYISIVATGGNSDYNYSWSHTELSQPTFSNMTSGIFSVTAYDKLGCKAGIPNIFIPYVNVNIETQLEMIRDNNCYKDKKASIASTIFNGNIPYDYNWSHGVQYFDTVKKDTIKDLGAGVYSLTVTDRDGCTGISNMVIVEEKQPFSYLTEEIKGNICNTDSTGLITIQVDGGVMPIGILWNGGLYAGPRISGLPNGVYSGLIQDANGCVLTIKPITISSESDITLNAVVTNDTDLTSTGEICISPAGGEGPYTIQWSDGSQNSACITMLAAGQYSVTVTDRKLCTVKEGWAVQNISKTEESGNIQTYIFPNPADGVLNLISSKPFRQLEIIQYNGLTTSKLTMLSESYTATLQIEGLKPGVYFIKIGHAASTSVLKWVKI